MRKAILFLIIAMLCTVLILSACKDNQTSDEETVVDADQPVPEEPVEDTTPPEDTTVEDTTTDTTDDETADDTTNTTEPEENLTTIHKVRVTKSDLTPQHITIKNGDTVKWVNARSASTASAGKFMILFQSPYREIKMTNAEQSNKEWSYTFEGYEAGTVLRYGEVIYEFSGSVTIEE